MTQQVNLVVVAHPDDEILGFGGAGAAAVRRGERVQPVILCGGVDARTQRPSSDELQADIQAANALLGFDAPILGSFPNIRMNTVDHIEVVRFIEAQILQFQPTRLFTHHPGDLNDDHVQVARAAAAASRYFQRRSDIRPLQSLAYMEILSATDWAFPGGAAAFQPNAFVEVEDTLDLKLQALALYRNVMRDFPHPRSQDVLKGLAAYRGGQSGLRHAEAFQTVFRLGL